MEAGAGLIQPWTILLRMFLSLISGGLLGYERSLKGVDAGFRTHIIVCMSSCAIMLTNLYLFEVYRTGDPTRMPAQVISGVGFLGAGCILVTRNHRIKGVTTAAGVWAAACLGLCIGAGNYIVSLFELAAVFISMTFFRAVDQNIDRKTRSVRFYAELESVSALTHFIKRLQEMDIRITDLETIESKVSDGFAVVVNIHLRKPDSTDRFIAMLGKMEGVVYISGL